MKKENTIYLVSIFALVSMMAAFFPTVGSDISWKLLEIDSFVDLLDIQNRGLVTSSLFVLFSRYNFMRIIGTGACVTLLFATIKNAINKNNSTLLLLGGLLFFLLDKDFFAVGVVSYAGLITYLIDSLFLILLMNLIIKNAFLKMNKISLFILGLIFSSLNVSTSSMIFMITFIYFLYCRKEREEIANLVFLVLGELIGLVYLSLNSHLEYIGFCRNLIHGFIPAITNVNFLLVILFSGVVMIQIPKMYAQTEKKGLLLSLGGISLYLFSSLFEVGDYINYITYVMYFISTFYVLYNFTNSRNIKRKIAIIYAFKLAFITVNSILSSIEVSSPLFLYILDIIVIALFYDHTWPERFLEPLWGGILAVFLLSNIYIYREVFYKNKDMDFYIKNRLECYRGDIILPSKYKNDYLYKSIPESKKEFDEYVIFHGIDVYDKDEPYIKISYKE